MNDSDEQVLSLVEEALNSGRTPDEVCSQSPEHLDEVRKRWRRIRNLVDDIERAFPGSDERRGPSDLLERAGSFPDIPGYVLESVIGYGGMGVVYKARHLKLDRVVAVKMLRGDARASPRAFAGLSQEARAIAALQHPHIVQVHDVGELDDRNGGHLPYFTMEYVEGGSLAGYLRGKPVTATEAATLIASLADAVQAAHAGGVVHRDLKPGNILLGHDKSPKITDFGLARRSQGDPLNTLSPAAVGTPSYMAPEQALGTQEAFGPSVDVYALGAVLYELLTGRPPFCADSNAETQRQVVAEDPVPPSRLNPKTPRDLETICLKCLQKTPARRYATAREVSEDAGRFLRGEPINARPVGRVERLRKWVVRHPGHAAAVAGTVAAIVAVVGATLWTASQRAAYERAASDDLVVAARLEAASDWRSARNILERAKTRLEGASNRDRLSLKAAEIERELDLVDRLEGMRLNQRASTELEFNQSKWWREYRETFAAAGLLVEGDTSEAFAARVARSPVRTALVAAMDDMVICAPTDPDIDWILLATRLADPDPWRDRARDKSLWNNTAAFPALAALAREAPVEGQPVPLLLNMAGRLLEFKSSEAEDLLRRVQTVHPSDFWATFALAETLDARHDADAIGYFRAAVALRPDAGVAHFSLASALGEHDRLDEAIESMRRAVALDPRSFAAQYDLALWLLRQGRAEAALEPARKAAQLDHPKQAMAHSVLGSALAKLGRYCDAAESYGRALELMPGDEQLRKRLEQMNRECDAATARPPASGTP